MKKVSVIIPTFNRKNFLKEAIESVLLQSYKNFEIIVVDDGSTDGTREMIKSEYKMIKYIYQKNSGPSAARNRGIVEAKGEYISFLDSDDLWLKDKLKEEMEFLEENREYKICYTDEIWIRNGKRVNPKKKHRKYSGWIFEKTLPLCIISPSSVIIHRSVFAHVGLFDESLFVCEDYDLWLRVSSKYPIYFLEKKLIIKRGGHDDQISNLGWGYDIFRVKALKKFIESPENQKNYRIAAFYEMEKKCRILINGLKKRNKTKDAENFENILKTTKKILEI